MLKPGASSIPMIIPPSPVSSPFKGEDTSEDWSRALGHCHWSIEYEKPLKHWIRHIHSYIQKALFITFIDNLILYYNRNWKIVNSLVKDHSENTEFWTQEAQNSKEHRNTEAHYSDIQRTIRSGKPLHSKGHHGGVTFYPCTSNRTKVPFSAFTLLSPFEPLLPYYLYMQKSCQLVDAKPNEISSLLYMLVVS